MNSRVGMLNLAITLYFTRMGGMPPCHGMDSNYYRLAHKSKVQSSVKSCQ